MRNRAERRKNDWRAIRRKAAIIRSAWGDSEWLQNFWGKQMHRLSKHSFSDPQFNEKNLSSKPSIKDQRKLEALDFEDYDEIG